MNDREFRMECLRLAATSMGMSGEDVVGVAERYFQFVSGTSEEPAPPPEACLAA
jgi:hypothetical protein